MLTSIFRARRRSCRRVVSVESLESRQLLSNITWTNRGSTASDSDGFNEIYGNNAIIARIIVDEAIRDWETVIQDFNYNNVGSPGYAAQDNTYTLNLSAVNFAQAGLNGQSTIVNIDLNGKPLAAVIELDDNAGGQGWYFDTTPTDHSEFTTITSAYSGTFTQDKGVDFYRTVAHEIGHALGIAVAPNLAINNFLTPDGTDAIDRSSRLQNFEGPTISTTLTENGGGHLYELAAPNDLLNPGRSVASFGVVERRLISDTVASVLRDAYGYSIMMPSNHESLFARLNTNTGVLSVSGVTSSSDNDSVLIQTSGTMLRVEVKGQTDFFPLSQVTQVNVATGAGGDTIVVDSTSVPVSISGGADTDVITLGNLTDGIGQITSPVTVNGDSLDTLTINDLAAGGVIFYTLDSNRLDRTGAASVSFAGLNLLEVFMGPYSDYLTVAAIPTSTTLIGIDGGTGSDQITGSEVANRFIVTNPDRGLINNRISFSNVENLAGGSAFDDEFIIRNGASLSGGIDGRGGIDRLDLSKLGQNVTANLETGAVTSIAGGMASIESLEGNSQGGDTLIGWNRPTEWVIDNWGQGYLFDLDVWESAVFHGFESLVGGTAADTFTLYGGGGLSGQIDGGDGGGDTISYAGVTGSVAVNLQTKSASRLLTGWTRINNFIGGSSGNDTLTGPSQSSTWTLTGQNKGSVYNYNLGKINWDDFENLNAGSGNDWFKVQESFQLDGSLDAGAGLNTLDYRTFKKQTVFVNLENDDATAFGSVDDIDRVFGGHLDDILLGSSGNDILNGHHGNDLLVGRDGNDDLFGGYGDDALFGGYGNDALNGQSGNDLVIAGVTTYEQASSTSALLKPLTAIHDLWRNVSLSFSERVSKLRNGYTTPDKQFIQLNQNTVQEDHAAEGKIQGGSGSDWIWIFAGDSVFDQESQDQIN